LTVKRTGLLAKPIDWDGNPVDEFWEKLNLLCEHFCVERTSDGDLNWMDLAIKLLLEHEPGFRSAAKCGRKRGRPRDWRKDIALILDVDHVIGKRRRSDSEAIHILTTSPRFAKRWNGENERTLRNRLSAGRRDKELAIIIDLARKEARGRGFADLWDLADQAYQFKKRGRPPKKTVAGRQKTEGETPDQTKAAENAQKGEKVEAQIPTPPKPDKPEEEMTYAEMEVLRRARAMFQ
jgi:hypothetical protein